MKKIFLISSITSFLIADLSTATYKSQYFDRNGNKGFAKSQAFYLNGDGEYTLVFKGSYRTFEMYSNENLHNFNNNFRVFIPNFTKGIDYSFITQHDYGYLNIIYQLDTPPNLISTRNLPTTDDGSSSNISFDDLTTDTNSVDCAYTKYNNLFSNSKNVMEMKSEDTYNYQLTFMLENDSSIYTNCSRSLYIKDLEINKELSKNSLDKWLYFGTDISNPNNTIKDSYVNFKHELTFYNELVDEYVNSHQELLDPTLNPNYSFCDNNNNYDKIYSESELEDAKAKLINLCLYVTSFGDDGDDNDYTTHSNILRNSFLNDGTEINTTTTNLDEVDNEVITGIENNNSSIDSKFDPIKGKIAKSGWHLIGFGEFNTNVDAIKNNLNALQVWFYDGDWKSSGDITNYSGVWIKK